MDGTNADRIKRQKKRRKAKRNESKFYITRRGQNRIPGGNPVSKEMIKEVAYNFPDKFTTSEFVKHRFNRNRVNPYALLYRLRDYGILYHLGPEENGSGSVWEVKEAYKF